MQCLVLLVVFFLPYFFLLFFSLWRDLEQTRHNDGQEQHLPAARFHEFLVVLAGFRHIAPE